MTSPEQNYLTLTAQADKGVKLDEATVTDAFAKLQPVDAAYLTKGAGEWQGHDFDTGHPTHQKMESLKWAGKTFRGVDDVDPIVVYDEQGKRVWNADWGHAQLREISYLGTNTIAMVYDDFPIIDYFRFVTPDLVAGAMDSKKMKPYGTYYFFLTRIS